MTIFNSCKTKFQDYSTAKIKNDQLKAKLEYMYKISDEK